MAHREDANKTGPRANVTVSLSFDEIALIEARATEMQMSRAGFIRHAALKEIQEARNPLHAMDVADAGVG